MNPNEPLSVDERITLLEQKQDEDLAELKNQLSETTESLKPINLLKEAGGKIASSGSFRKAMVIGVVGFGIGYLLKRMIAGKSASPVKKIMGFAAQLLVPKLVAMTLP